MQCEGQEAFTEALKSMEADDPWEMEIEKIITYCKDTAVNGILKSNDGKPSRQMGISPKKGCL